MKLYPRVLFYSVDYRRDTVRQLSTYMTFFDEAFVGLTHLDDPENPHLPFEQGLGIVSQLVPNLEAEGDHGPDDYQVVHGVTLFLLNPRGELQAIFEPEEVAPGVHAYDPERLAEDYRAVRRYIEG
jgi:protein SCO1/2